MSITTTDRLKELLPQLFSQQQAKGNYYLRFQLTNDLNLLLDLSYVQESLTVESSQITAMPNFPNYVMGLMSSRNQVFLALDLAHLAGFAPQTLNQRQYQIIVVRVDSSQAKAEELDLYGLSVKRIQGVSRILPEKFQSSPAAVPENLRPFLSGFVRDVENNGDRSIKPSQLQPAFLIDLPRLIASRV